jgi:uncharacterized glyoxalase superfamily protein PhnB
MPVLVYEDVGEAVEWLCRTFGFVERDEHARKEGARIVSPPTDYPYGERQYSAEDLSGRRWTFTQSIADVAPEEWGGTSAQL